MLFKFLQLTCTRTSSDPEHVCETENAILWAWYFLSSIAFSGIIMVTKLLWISVDQINVISGPPAVGKTTVAKGLAEEFQLQP